MIEMRSLQFALAAVNDMSRNDRLALLDALTRLQMTDESWREAAPLARLVLADLESDGPIAGAADILARVPIQSIRESLRRMAESQEYETSRAAALALARVRDPAALPSLMRDFHQSLEPEVGKALAGLPLESLGVRSEEIDPGFGSTDEMTRLWTAIASGRVRGDKGYAWEPLEQLWDSLVRPPEFLRQSRRTLMFQQPPRLFAGDPWSVMRELGSVRPLPENLCRFVIGLQQNDFDGWTPRQPDLVQDSVSVRAFVAGLTGDAAYVNAALAAAPQVAAPVAPPYSSKPLPAPQPPQMNDVFNKASDNELTELIHGLLDKGQSADGVGALMDVEDVLGKPRPAVKLIDDSRPRSGGHKAKSKPPPAMEPGAAASEPPELQKPAPTAEPSLHFVLQGEHASGAVMRAKSDAELIFRFDVPPINALATADNAALDGARKADIDIELRVTARGALSLPGARSGTAQFLGGRMIADVVFPISAGEYTDASSSVHVDFSVKGESVYQMEMPIRVVALKENIDRAPAPPSTEQTVPLALMQDALTAAKPPSQRIQLSLSFDGGRFCIEVTDLRDGQIEFQQRFVSQAIERTRLETLLKTVHTTLGPSYKDAIWGQFDGTVPADDSGRTIVAALSRTLETVAIAGSRLNQDLRTDAEIKNALEYIEQNGTQGALITVSTDDIFLPWEIIYPGLRTANMTPAQKDKNPVLSELFWGARFAIETVQRGSGSLGKLRQRQLARTPAVSLNLNSSISLQNIDAAKQPIAVQHAWAKRLKEQGQLDNVQDTCDDIRGVLQDAIEDATLIYVYCHGASSNPFGGVDESLTLCDEDCRLQPADLESGPTYKNAPIVFLNSCMAGAFSPLTFSNFHSQFRKRGALGMIATTFAVPIMFGSRFGQEVVDCYLQRRGSLAVALLALRRKHLIERGDPVPLFYSLQCQIDFGTAINPGVAPCPTNP